MKRKPSLNTIAKIVYNVPYAKLAPVLKQKIRSKRKKLR